MVAMLALLVALLAAAVVARRSYSVEARNADVHVSPQAATGRVTVLVTGFITHSGLCVAATPTTVDRERLIVRVLTIQPREGASCSSTFRVETALPREVREIWFGTPPDSVFLGRFFLGRLPTPTGLHDWLSGRGGVIVWQRPPLKSRV